MPRPLAFAVLALIVIGISLGVVVVVRHGKEHQAAEKPVPIPAK